MQVAPPPARPDRRTQHFQLLAVTFAVVLIHVPEDFAVALQRSLAIDNRRVLALHHWSSEVAPKNVCLIVASAHSPVAETLSFRRTTAAPLIVLSRSSIAERAAALDAGADASLDLGDPVVLSLIHI